MVLVQRTTYTVPVLPVPVPRHYQRVQSYSRYSSIVEWRDHTRIPGLSASLACVLRRSPWGGLIAAFSLASVGVELGVEGRGLRLLGMEGERTVAFCYREGWTLRTSSASSRGSSFW